MGNDTRDKEYRGCKEELAEREKDRIDRAIHGVE